MSIFLAPAPFDFAGIFKSIITRWYLYVALAVFFVALFLIASLVKKPKVNNLSKTQSIVYMAILSALCVVANVVQIPTPFFQASLVATMAFVAGVLMGGAKGFVVAFLGDLIAGIVAPQGVYSPIIGVGTGMFALIPGVIMHNTKFNVYVKIVISFVLSFAVSSVLLNTIGVCLIYSPTALVTRLAELPISLVVHCLNCALSIGLYQLLKKILPKEKFPFVEK